MAPEIVRDAVAELDPETRFLDPMCGSGVTVRLAIEQGMNVLGFDIDPLAALMSRVWTTRIDIHRFLRDARAAVDRACSSDYDTTPLPWQDAETWQYIKYWFDHPQIDALVRLSKAIADCETKSQEALKIALSRIVVTKDRGASLARDSSHSRPHKSWKTNDYDVLNGFIKSARVMANRLNTASIKGTSSIDVGDCRSLTTVEDNSVDCTVTSPPYLNALDYIRGHRLSLVWLGFSLTDLRAIRSSSVGAERGLGGVDDDIMRYVTEAGQESLAEFPAKCKGWLRRYTADASGLISELARILRTDGKLVLVVGNSFLRGYKVDNAMMFKDTLIDKGFHDVSHVERSIPSQNRYLPPPDGSSPLATRMRTEVILTGFAP